MPFLSFFFLKCNNYVEISGSELCRKRGEGMIPKRLFGVLVKVLGKRAKWGRKASFWDCKRKFAV